MRKRRGGGQSIGNAVRRTCQKFTGAHSNLLGSTAVICRLHFFTLPFQLSKQHTRQLTTAIKTTATKQKGILKKTLKANNSNKKCRSNLHITFLFYLSKGFLQPNSRQLTMKTVIIKQNPTKKKIILIGAQRGRGGDLNHGIVLKHY